MGFTYVANGATSICQIDAAEVAAGYDQPDVDSAYVVPAEGRYGAWADEASFIEGTPPVFTYDPDGDVTLAAKPTLSADMIRPYGGVLGCTVATSSTATLTGVGFGDNGQRPDTPAGTWFYMSGPAGCSVGSTTNGVATLTTGANAGTVHLRYVSGSHQCDVYTTVA
jgi:hypothetical protein